MLSGVKQSSPVSDPSCDTRLRFTEQIALGEIAPQCLQPFQLLLRFNPFCNRLHIERLRHTGDESDDIQGILLGRYRVHEGFVYFDLIEGQLTQPGKRRVSRTKVINGYLHAAGSELIQRLQRRVVLGKERGFRHFQLKTTGRESTLFQNRQHDPGKGFTAELYR